MSPMSALTLGAVPTATTPTIGAQRWHLRPCSSHAQFHADLTTVRLRHGGKSRISATATAIPVHHGGGHRQLPILAARRVASGHEPTPAANFAFFREPLKQNPALMAKWGAAANAGSQSEAWSHFVSDVSERFFKGSRRQRVMDALVLSIDLLPARHRADALACLLSDGADGRAAVEEFWPYVGIYRIPDTDRPRVAALIRQSGIGM